MKNQKRRYEEICDALSDADVDYYTYQDKYICVPSDTEDITNFADVEEIVENDPRTTLIIPCGPDSEEDMYDALSQCGLYCGQ